MAFLGESGIDVTSDTIENIVDAVAPVVAGPRSFGAAPSLDASRRAVKDKVTFSQIAHAGIMKICT